MSEKIPTPAERAALSKQKDEERREANRYKFPAGNGPDKDGLGHHGKVTGYNDTQSQKKGTPVWEVLAKTEEKDSKNKTVEIKLNFWKSDKALDFLYKFLEMAGADISGLPARIVNEDLHDEMVNKCMEALDDKNSKFRFACTHKARPGVPGHENINMQKDGVNINYYIREFAEVDGKLPLRGVLDPATQTKAPVEEKVETEEAEKEAVTDAPTDSAFGEFAGDDE